MTLKESLEGIKILYIALTNFKLYRRWSKIQYIKMKRQEEKEKAKWEELLKNAEKINKIKSFSLRRKPKLLKFYKLVRFFKNILIKTFLFVLKAIGILITIILFCHLFSWVGDNPLWIIIILLIMILLKK